jgi:aerobic carbon-monoxide dehydrogenase large subunit
MNAPALLRKEDRRLLAGRTRFTDDVHLDNMVQGVFIRSPHAHADLVSIDASEAMAAGALLVLTSQDLPFLDQPYIVRYWHPSIRNGMPKFLAQHRVRYVGEPVAFLVADDRYLAEDLAALVKIEYRPLPAIATITDARSPEAAPLHDEWTGNIAATYTHSQGAMPAAMAACPRRLCRTFKFARQVPLPLETRGCVADFNGDSNTLTAWISTQAHYNVRQNLASLLDVPEYNVRVIAEDVGGGFGGKSRTFAEEIVTCHASRVLSRPVKWIEDRFEHLQATTHSRAMETELEMGYNDDGRILALRGKLTLDIGAYVFTSGIITADVAGGCISGAYKITDIAFEVFCVGTNKTPVATYRGAGQPEATFPLECLLDLVAKDVGISPAEVRRRNLVAPADLPFMVGTPKGWAKVQFHNGDFPAAFAKALQNSGYDESVEILPTGERAAWGFACSIEGSGFVNYESAQVLVDSAGKVVVRSGMTSQGQGQITVFGQVCAEILDVDVDDVTVRLGDTDLIDFGRGAFATRGAVVGANAVAGATQLIREKILKHASTLLQVKPDALSISKGRIIHAGGAPTGLGLSDIAKAVVPGGPLYTGETALEAQFIFDIKGQLTLGYGVQFARVAVDVRSGRFRILDVYVLHDSGRVLNAPLLAGQIVGGVVDGIGGATLSEMVYGDDGQLLTGSLADYLVITAPEVPRIRLDHFKTTPLTNPLGVRGVGEGGIIATGPAIVNALSRIIAPDGLGGEEPLFSLPVKPEAVLRAWRGRQAPKPEGALQKS